MQRQQFAKIVEEVLDSLPREFRERIRNVAVLVEDLPPDQLSHQSESPRQPVPARRLLLGLFHGVPMTKKSVFDLQPGPDYVGCPWIAGDIRPNRVLSQNGSAQIRRVRIMADTI